MARCSEGTSKCILLTSNTLIFLIAGASLGVTLYIFFDIAAKSLTKGSLLTVIAIVSVALMLFAMLGCKAALTPPSKKCSKCMYLTILLVFFLAEFVVAGYIFNLGHALDVAKDKGFNVTSEVNKAAEDALVFLHDSLNDLYKDEQCKGGGATNNEKIPFGFNAITCKTQKVDDAFKQIFQSNRVINETEDYDIYTNCTADPKFKKEGSADFTQAFCGSEAHIVSLATEYARYIKWFPVALAALTFVLLVATICLIAQRQQRSQRQVRLHQGDQRLQMANP
jgi:hypothetical protein